MKKRAAGIVPLSTAIVLVGILYWAIYALQANNKSAAAINMPSMHMNDMGTFWAFPIMQAAGLVALLFSWFSVALGLKQTRATKKTLLGMDVEKLHRSIGLVTFGLVLAHAIFDSLNAMGDNFATVFWFNGWAKNWPDANLAYNLGVAGFYALLLLAPSFYLRKVVGERTWRTLHRLILVAYGISVWHALILGADVAYYHWVRPVVWLAQIPLFWWLSKRMSVLGARSGQSVAGKVTVGVIKYLSWLAIPTILVLVFTGEYAHLVQTLQTVGA